MFLGVGDRVFSFGDRMWRWSDLRRTWGSGAFNIDTRRYFSIDKAGRIVNEKGKYEDVL